ncbi:MAG: glutathione S-transferase N-terminal domain-containing protein [Gammaproteobacteria bacterium]
MKLFTYATSPYARKVRMALDYKSVSYEPIERCYSIDRQEDLRGITPRAEVPTVVLDYGRTITDSTIGATAGWNGRFGTGSSIWSRASFTRGR